MVKFALNSLVSATTRFAPFKLTRGYLSQMIKELAPSSLPGVQQFAEHVRDNLMMAHDTTIEAFVYQMHYANKCCCDEQIIHSEHRPIKESDLLYLLTGDLNLPKGRVKKLTLHFIGPYKVLEAHSDMSNYKLDLSKNLKKCGIHPVFHISCLCCHKLNNDELFPHQDTQVYYDLGTSEDTEYLVDEIIDTIGKAKHSAFKCDEMLKGLPQKGHQPL